MLAADSDGHGDSRPAVGIPCKPADVTRGTCSPSRSPRDRGSRPGFPSRTVPHPPAHPRAAGEDPSHPRSGGHSQELLAYLRTPGSRVYLHFERRGTFLRVRRLRRRLGEPTGEKGGRGGGIPGASSARDRDKTTDILGKRGQRGGLEKKQRPVGRGTRRLLFRFQFPKYRDFLSIPSPSPPAPPVFGSAYFLVRSCATYRCPCTLTRGAMSGSGSRRELPSDPGVPTINRIGTPAHDRAFPHPSPAPRRNLPVASAWACPRREASRRRGGSPARMRDVGVTSARLGLEGHERVRADSIPSATNNNARLSDELHALRAPREVTRE